MIRFDFQKLIALENSERIKNWIQITIENENRKESGIDFIFCSDKYLYNINFKYLKHKTLTDIISFDYSLGSVLKGEIYISVDRVKENAVLFNANFTDELHRVIIHGVLHLCGYRDKKEEEKRLMRSKEDYYLSLRPF
jgi:rRNA maturation RNase YbeY